MFKSSLSNTELQALVNNLETQFPKASFTVARKAFLVSKIVALAQSVLDSRAAVTTARGALAVARTESVEVEDSSVPIISAVRALIVPMLLNDPGALNALALAPPKVRKPLSTQARITAREKLRATRTARGTTSKQQKAKITGGVTSVIVTPVTASGVSAPIATSTASSANDVVAAPASPAVTPASTATVAAPVGAVVTPGH